MIESIASVNGMPMGHSVVNLVVNAGALAKIVLLLLLFFSLGSWGIMLDKYLQFSRLKKTSTEFLRLFKRAENPEDLAAQLKKSTPGPLVRIFAAGYRHLERESPDRHGHPVYIARDRSRLDLALDDAIMTEVQLLEQRVTFLGTCGSITPFLGLFGTVWGIMTAFRGIGVAGSASIAAVAPGIAEALVTTAAGLAAAIPAVMAYNYFLNRIRSANIMFERFRSSFLALLE